ncbi:hypothetical protein HGA02_01280 [Cellulomonas septica]|uniref:Uncharacterized protein n=1 Tax=Cellulomonas septica TaxID=285080 RepID=A0ABX1JV73_9CELL|nr:hypothetical protein [Cellulomonas septica]
MAWIAGHRLQVRVLGDADKGHEVVIMGDAAGLEDLARRLLTLAQEGVPSGMHLHLEESSVLYAPSASLVLEREDDPEEYRT